VLHARVVEATETLSADRLSEQVERLASHALRGELWDKALTYCRQAGEKAMARSAYREAVGSFEQALSALPHLPEQRDTREQAIDLRLALRSALLPSGDSERILAYLHEAEALAAALDDPRRLGQVTCFLSLQFYHRGAYDQAIARAQRALTLATAGGEVVPHALANYFLGVAYQAQGDYQWAIDCLGQTVASFAGARRHERFGFFALPAVVSRAWLAVCHAELGTFAEGSALGAEGLRIAEAVAHPGSLMWACYGLGHLSLLKGDLHEALPPPNACWHSPASTRNAATRPMALRLLGDIAAHRAPPDVDAAATHYRQALALTEELGMRPLVAHCHRGLGTLYATTGQREQARAELSAALALYREMAMTFWLPQTEAALAQMEEE
jgi:tetratricopeptide (TPR) repeat protein